MSHALTMGESGIRAVSILWFLREQESLRKDSMRDISPSSLRS
eukprot:CAMPEP_0168416744 /NCGR_PEP_ID=MMETSP0228-20121227/30893_1 /TAXON_ID=133427 /ORGANISM="Protoceratium reticulatum, Strain CCCM 535 (=CCMP 1889)" /LENGTH=42 /DNA_ID= /DNA_START= /DNA_END= /DNA_ORIENTATION=